MEYGYLMNHAWWLKLFFYCHTTTNANKDEGGGWTFKQLTTQMLRVATWVARYLSCLFDKKPKSPFSWKTKLLIYFIFIILTRQETRTQWMILTYYTIVCVVELWGKLWKDPIMRIKVYNLQVGLTWTFHSIFTLFMTVLDV